MWCLLQMQDQQDQKTPSWSMCALSRFDGLNHNNSTISQHDQLKRNLPPFLRFFYCHIVEATVPYILLCLVCWQALVWLSLLLTMIIEGRWMPWLFCCLMRDQWCWPIWLYSIVLTLIKHYIHCQLCAMCLSCDSDGDWFNTLMRPRDVQQTVNAFH